MRQEDVFQNSGLQIKNEKPDAVSAVSIHRQLLNACGRSYEVTLCEGGGLESATDFLPPKLQKAAYGNPAFHKKPANSVLMKTPLPFRVVGEFLSLKLPLHQQHKPPA
ncbi:hypothetical protein Baya_14529 [Bagarius yarrelli]|uniref:Uncharacterized protein n=1 Tax=Bagarius yarrelli TaxID=175774 RepID=A0A556V964_BAGYA|nr:hypothetical protein Baya_14529 [Bagarius yarrelli]